MLARYWPQCIYTPAHLFAPTRTRPCTAVAAIPCCRTRTHLLLQTFLYFQSHPRSLTLVLPQFWANPYLTHFSSSRASPITCTPMLLHFDLLRVRIFFGNALLCSLAQTFSSFRQSIILRVCNSMLACFHDSTLLTFTSWRYYFAHFFVPSAPTNLRHNCLRSGQSAQALRLRCSQRRTYIFCVDHVSNLRAHVLLWLWTL